MKDPQQELFAAIREKIVTEYGEDHVYDYIPGREAEYPFIYLGDSQMLDDAGNKSILLANVFQTITIWAESPKMRGTLSGMLFRIKELLRGIEGTDCYAWRLLSIDQRIDTDAETNALRGDITAEYKLTGGFEK